MTTRFIPIAVLTFLCLCLPHTVAAPALVAHRGASHDAPENTLAAFHLAWEQGADAVEGDFYLTMDGRIVCIHDRTTKRTTDANKVVAESTLKELQSLDAGSWKAPRWEGERLPTLKQVLDTVPDGKRLFVEIKCGPEIVEPLKQVLAASDLKPEQTVVIAFDASVVKAVKRQIPGIKAYWLTSYKQNKITGAWAPSLDSILKTLRDTHADGLDSNAHKLITDKMVATLKSSGFEFHVWTVDDPKLATRMSAVGADSITTNRPEWLREQMRAGAE